MDEIAQARVEQGHESRPPCARQLVHPPHDGEGHRERRLGRLGFGPAGQLALVARAVDPGHVEQRVEEGGALAEEQGQPPQWREPDVAGHLHQPALLQTEIGLGVDTVVDRSRGCVVEEIVRQAHVEHHGVGRVREALSLELEQLLIGPVPLDAEVHHLQPRVERLHHRREGLAVAHAVAERDRIAEHHDARAAGRTRRSHFPAAIAEPVDRGLASRQRVAERGPGRPAVDGRVGVEVREVVERDALQITRVGPAHRHLGADEEQPDREERRQREQDVLPQAAGAARAHAISDLTPAVA